MLTCLSNKGPLNHIDSFFSLFLCRYCDRMKRNWFDIETIKSLAQRVNDFLWWSKRSLRKWRRHMWTSNRHGNIDSTDVSNSIPNVDELNPRRRYSSLQDIRHGRKLVRCGKANSIAVFSTPIWRQVFKRHKIESDLGQSGRRSRLIRYQVL